MVTMKELERLAVIETQIKAMAKGQEELKAAMTKGQEDLKNLMELQHQDMKEKFDRQDIFIEKSYAKKHIEKLVYILLGVFTTIFITVLSIAFMG